MPSNPLPLSRYVPLETKGWGGQPLGHATIMHDLSLHRRSLSHPARSQISHSRNPIVSSKADRADGLVESPSKALLENCSRPVIRPTPSFGPSDRRAHRVDRSRLFWRPVVLWPSDRYRSRSSVRLKHGPQFDSKFVSDVPPRVSILCDRLVHGESVPTDFEIESRRRDRSDTDR